MLVMLRADWPSDTFRRAGNSFARGVPVEINEVSLPLLASDLGKSLVLVNASNAKADHEATREAAEDCVGFLARRAAPPPADESAGEATSEAPAATTETAAMVEPPPRRKR